MQTAGNYFATGAFVDFITQSVAHLPDAISEIRDFKFETALARVGREIHCDEIEFARGAPPLDGDDVLRGGIVRPAERRKHFPFARADRGFFERGQ